MIFHNHEEIPVTINMSIQIFNHTSTKAFVIQNSPYRQVNQSST